MNIERYRQHIDSISIYIESPRHPGISISKNLYRDISLSCGNTTQRSLCLSRLQADWRLCNSAVVIGVFGASQSSVKWIINNINRTCHLGIHRAQLSAIEDGDASTTIPRDYMDDVPWSGQSLLQQRTKAARPYGDERPSRSRFEY